MFFIEAYFLNILIQIRFITLSVPSNVEVFSRVDIFVLLPLLLKNIVIILVLALLRNLVHEGDFLAIFSGKFGGGQVHMRPISLDGVVTTLQISSTQH